MDGKYTYVANSMLIWTIFGCICIVIGIFLLLVDYVLTIAFCSVGFIIGLGFTNIIFLVPMIVYKRMQKNKLIDFLNTNTQMKLRERSKYEKHLI